MNDDERAVKYLVTEKDGTTHLPYTKEDGKPDHGLMGAAWAALHGGYRGKKYAGPDKEKAIEKLKSVYKSEKMDTPSEKKGGPDLDELRAIGERMSSATAERSLSKDEQAAVIILQKARAICYASQYYLCYVPNQGFPDGVWSALTEAFECCDLFLRLLFRESPIAPTAAELCAAGCRQVSDVCSGTDDEMLSVCVAVCTKAADVCDTMAAVGEADEGRKVAGREEVRSLKYEIRSDGDSRRIVGYPIRFNELSEDLGGFRERILRDAVVFAEDVRADFNHDPNCILGRSRAGTLKLTTDDKGVRMEADAPETGWANDLLVSIRRGDIDQGSFAFRVLPGGQQTAEENGQMVRTLSKILVRKVSVVSDPAYTKTSVEVRSRSAKLSAPTTAGQAAPSAKKGGGGVSHLRRLQAQAESEK